VRLLERALLGSLAPGSSGSDSRSTNMYKYQLNESNGLLILTDLFDVDAPLVLIIRAVLPLAILVSLPNTFRGIQGKGPRLLIRTPPPSDGHQQRSIDAPPVFLVYRIPTKTVPRRGTTSLWFHQRYLRISRNSQYSMTIICAI
jgi:hypothetical protein